MTAASKQVISNIIRLGRPLNLIFFVAYLLASCGRHETASLRLHWINGQPSRLTVPVHLFKEWTDDTDLTYVQVRFGNNSAAVLGGLTLDDNAVTFEPLLPFTRASNYQVYFRDRLIASVRVPGKDPSAPARVLAVYPAADSLPENLLKMYLVFSVPMREGVSAKYLALQDDKGQQLPDVLLPLNPELWNEDRTVLTVWFDPGRIKRGLIPNEKMGNPLHTGKGYALRIDGAWPSAASEPLQQSTIKRWTAIARDTVLPNPAHWQLQLPAAGSVAPLQIALDEPLDHFVLVESLAVQDQAGSLIAGRIEATPGDMTAMFYPADPWSAGSYRLVVDPVLEDLAGNNLQRPFDRDLQAPAPRLSQTVIPFIIAPGK